MRPGGGRWPASWRRGPGRGRVRAADRDAAGAARNSYRRQTVDHHLHRLHQAGLAQPDPRGWRRDPRTDAHRADLADRLGVAGILTRGHQRHRAEREAWAWWWEELTWMRAPRHPPPHPPPPPPP